MKRIPLFNKEAYWTNVYSSTHSTVYSYIANSTNSIYSISNRLSSALVSATLSIITVSLLIDMRISFSVHINMKASKLSWLNELRSLFFTNFKVEKLLSHATLTKSTETYMLTQWHDKHLWGGCTVRVLNWHKWHSFCRRNRSCFQAPPLVIFCLRIGWQRYNDINQRGDGPVFRKPDIPKNSPPGII